MDQQAQFSAAGYQILAKSGKARLVKAGSRVLAEVDVAPQLVELSAAGLKQKRKLLQAEIDAINITLKQIENIDKEA